MIISATAFSKKALGRLQDEESINHVHIPRLPNQPLDILINRARNLKNSVLHVPCNAINDMPATIECLKESEQKVLLLSGAPIAGKNPYDTTSAVEKFADAGIETMVGGYPEWYFSINSQRHRLKDIDVIKRKCDAGATAIAAQVSYRPKVIISWIEALREAGINVPINIGISAPNSVMRYIKNITATKMFHTLYSGIELDFAYRIAMSHYCDPVLIAHRSMESGVMSDQDGFRIEVGTNKDQINIAKAIRSILKGV